MSTEFKGMIYGNMSNSEIQLIQKVGRQNVANIEELEDGEQRVTLKCGCAFETRKPFKQVDNPSGTHTHS